MNASRDSQLFFETNLVAFLSCHLILQLPLNIKVTSKYHGISNNIISDWQMKNWL